MKIKFCWASRIVTWSSYLCEVWGKKFLVDCWMFQWRKEVFKRNFDDFLFNPSEVDYLFLTHAHLDHCWLIPKLVKHWFKWKIFTTSATIDLTKLILEDSANIQEETVKEKNKYRKKLWLPLRKPIYNIDDVHHSMKYFSSVEYEKLYEIDENIKVRYVDAWHILGSASIEVFLKDNWVEKKIVFSWDIWQRNVPIIQDPTLIDSADFVLIESTYWDRLHDDVSNRNQNLTEIIIDTYEKWWKLLIPSFSIERAQEVIYELNKIYKANKVKKEKIFLDSPLAIKTTEVFKQYKSLFDDEFINEYPHSLSLDSLEYTETVEQSKQIDHYKKPCIVIAWNGMCTAWRIKHHLKHWLSNNRNTVLIVWYQAEWTLWRILLEWEVNNVELMWENIPVNASIKKMNSFSAHADSQELVKWISWFKNKPKKVFIVHWEELSSLALWEKIDKLWFDYYIPRIWEEIEL